MRFSELLELLADTGHESFLLTGGSPGREVLCAPSLVGRVMSSTFDARRGNALGWIGVDAIKKGPVDPIFNNFGGEERLWFGPEGSQFGLHFARWPQNLTNYRVQPAVSSQAYQVTQISQDRDFLVMEARIELTNLAGTDFKLNVRRTIRMVESCPYSLGGGRRVESFGFQSETLVTNVSEFPIRKETGLICCWTLGQHPNIDGCFVVLPFKPGSVQRLGKPIRLDYCKDLCPGGIFPRARWSLGKNRALFQSDGKCRTKLAVSPARAVCRLGSVNFDGDELIINDFDCYPELPYVAPYWRHLSAEEILDGEALSCYIDGPDESGQRDGNFYELETLSPALPLQPRESFLHRNRVLHIRGSQASIESIATRFLHVGRADVAAFMQDRTLD